MRRIFFAFVFALLFVGQTNAQSANPVIESGGCGNANLAQGTGYFTIDPTGRNCIAAGPSPLGWYSFLNITGQATTTLKSGTGILHTITVNTAAAGAAETVTIFDSLSGSGTKIGTITVPSSAVPVTLTYDVQFATGLTIVTATASGDLTVSFK
jgi:hypothetical protein